MEYNAITGIKGHGGAFSVYERLKRLVHSDIPRVRDLCRSGGVYAGPDLKADFDNATYHYNEADILFEGTHTTDGCRTLRDKVKPALSSVFV